MTNRRQLLQLGLAASVWPAARAFGSAAAAEPARIYKAVCDGRYADSRAFAAAMRMQHVPVHEIDGDVTRVWYHDLALRWREAPAAIAGLTAPSALFCLEQLAWDHRMRLVFRAGLGRSGARAVHWIEAPARTLAEAAAGLEARDAAGLAVLAAHAVEAALEPGQGMRLRVPAAEPPAAEWVAWAIAPVHRG